MKVLLTLYGEERGPQDFTTEESGAEMAAWQAFDEAAREAGVLIACEGLADASPHGSSYASTSRSSRSSACASTRNSVCRVPNRSEARRA